MDFDLLKWLGLSSDEPAADKPDATVIAPSQPDAGGEQSNVITIPGETIEGNNDGCPACIVLPEMIIKPFVNIRTNIPIKSDYIIIDADEIENTEKAGFTKPTFINWHGGAKHYDTPGSATNPYKARLLTDVYQIILHETGGFSDPPIADPGLSVHFGIDAKGVVYQNNDILDLMSHAGPNNNTHTVGIEFTNDPFLTSGTNIHTSNAIIPINNLYSTDNRKLFFSLPSKTQLESLVRLVHTLMILLSIPNNNTSWLQIVPNPNDASSVTPNFFIMSRWGGMNKYSTLTQVGIISHRMFGHADGTFQALYCWLRLTRGIDSDKAYKVARDLIEVKEEYVYDEKKNDYIKKKVNLYFEKHSKIAGVPVGEYAGIPLDKIEALLNLPV